MFYLIVSNRTIKRSDVTKKFVKVGVRWLGFFYSLLHAFITIDTLIDRLESLDCSELPSKRLTGIRDNTLRCLKTIKGMPWLIKNVFDFAKVHFLCWRHAINSHGTNLFIVTVESSRMYADIGVKLNFGKPYFESVSAPFC